MRTLPASIAFVSLVASAFGQLPHLVGLTAAPTLAHRNHAACTTISQCPVVGLAPPSAAFPCHGGTGWDPVQRGAWVSNGPQIAVVSSTCGVLCPPSPVPTPAPITGLEVVESLNQVWATDAAGNICRLSRTCPPALISVCNTGLPATASEGLSGLAVDEGRQLVFYSHTDFTTGISGIFVAPLSAPCSPFFAIHPPAVCTVLVGVTGLAVDWGSSTLYLTDGFTTASWTYTAGPGPSIAFGAFNCCMIQGGSRFVGLAWQPQPPVPFGAPCANGSCPACPMVHTANGDPNLGNGFFALNLAGAPAGGLAWCQISIGTCAAPGVTIPPLCGPLYNLASAATPVLGTLGPNLLGGGAGCGPGTTFPLPLPAAPGLAGLPLASQCVVFCPGGLTGTTMSNCLSFILQGN